MRNHASKRKKGERYWKTPLAFALMLLLSACSLSFPGATSPAVPTPTATVTSAAPAPTDVPANAYALPGGVLLEAVFFNVGQADAILLRTPTHVMLVDAGNKQDGAMLITELTARGVKHIDYLVATHPHADHIGGMQEVLEHFSVANVIMPNITHTTKAFENLLKAIAEKGLKVQIANPGDTLNMGAAQPEILGPIRQDTKNLNNNSIVLYFTVGNARMLLTGDMEKEEEANVLARLPEIPAQLLKLGHHGSKTSSTKEFLAAVKPEIGIVTAEKDDDKRPAPSIVKDLKAYATRLFITGVEGNITARTGGEGFTVITEKSGQVIP